MNQLVASLIRYVAPIVVDEAVKYLRSDEGKTQAKRLRDEGLSALLPGAPAGNYDDQRSAG